MSKLITVFGATGQQGGSVIRTILQDKILSKEFKIRGITRDTSKAEAQALLKQGIDTMTPINTTPDIIVNTNTTTTVG
jgi:uncharacterized protein YbjT (DUF2867 family)